MPVENKKPMNEADKSAARVAARKAKLLRDKTARGNRDLTEQEKYAISTYRLAAKACEVAIESINQGGGFNGDTLSAAAQLCQFHNRTIG